jgi:5-formyltetrahydrofolate cyclo-ligase
MNDQKNLLRDQARKHRANIHVRAQDYEDAAGYFFDTIQTAGQIIAGYWPKGREFDPMPILELAANHNICALPVVQDSSKILQFAKWTTTTPMKDGAYGIPVPATLEYVEADILLLPLLAFDRRGYRLGQGGGYYDATLESLRKRKNVIAVGLAFSEQAVLFNLPVEVHDQKLDWIITPKGAQNFS